MTEFFLAVGDYILLSSFPALALFVGFYFFGSPWKKLLVGRSLMYFALALLLICTIVLLSLFLGPTYPGREFVRIFGYIGVSATSWRLFFTLRYIQKNPPPDVAAIGLTDFPEDEIIALADEIRARRERAIHAQESRMDDLPPSGDFADAD